MSWRSTDCLGYTPRWTDFDTHHNILWRTGHYTWWRNKLQRSYWNWLVVEQCFPPGASDAFYRMPWVQWFYILVSFHKRLMQVVSVNSKLMSINLFSFLWHVVFQVESRESVKHNWGMDCLVEFNYVICLVDFSTPMSSHTRVYRIQLAINVQIPVDYGGLGGKAIYIGSCLCYSAVISILCKWCNKLSLELACVMPDTEGSFMVERVFQIAEACIQDTLDNFSLKHKDFRVCEEKMQPKAFLANIFYFRICSYTEQIAVINYLDKFIAEQQNVSMK